MVCSRPVACRSACLCLCAQVGWYRTELITDDSHPIYVPNDMCIKVRASLCARPVADPRNENERANVSMQCTSYVR